ncbi:MAG: transposase [Gemmatimonadaceae bacterium]|nr:transposase [Gemmatimonadaceae bacterium]
MHEEVKIHREQIVSILKEASKKEKKLAEICRAHGIPVQTYHRWRRAHGGLPVSG